MKPLKKVLFALILSILSVTIQPAIHDVDQNDLHWLSLNIYYEAGNQPVLGKIAVGIVTLNRVKHDIFPDTVEDVVKQHKQFSWYNSKRVVIPDQLNLAWKESESVARYVLKMNANSDIMTMMGGITHFHATYVKPTWRKSMIKVAQIGDHIFYRMKEK